MADEKKFCFTFLFFFHSLSSPFILVVQSKNFVSQILILFDPDLFYFARICLFLMPHFVGDPAFFSALFSKSMDRIPIF